MPTRKYKNASIHELQKLAEHYKLFAEELRKEKKMGNISGSKPEEK